MIIGTGIDIIEISRIENAINKRKYFKNRVFTIAEQEYCSAISCSYERYAGRFAAKEAIGKAFGSSLSWLDVEILPTSSGKPEVVLHNTAAELGKGKLVHVSISHCRDYAIASAIVETI
ncbi:MAG: holo-ACP synthase [Armatimonadota bacterium]